MSQVGSFDPLVGRTFRGYRIERLIASGGMGSVYLAREESLANVVKVLKVLLAEAAKDPRTREVMLDRFEREAFAVSVLRHDNIAGIHAYGHLDDGQPCMVMDYVEGQTLHQLVSAQGRIPPYRVMHYMCHVSRGLDFAHAQGIVHRDLKPENIMLSPKDWDPHFCVLLDFGMAKITQSMLGNKLATMSGMALGTPTYMAVEQFRHSDEATAQSDIYSVAIIVWYLVTGELPWGPCDMSSPLGLSDLYERQRTRPPNAPPPGLLPPGWEQALRTALAPDPQQRHASVRHFMVELANGLESSGPHVKSGAQVLEAICPKFIATSGPDAETLRHAQTRTILEAAWPRLETPIRPAVADIRTRPALPRNRHPGQPTPVMGVGATSTLGAATGALLPQTTTPARRTRRLALFATMIVAVATTIGVVAMRGRSNEAIAPAASPAASTTPTGAASAATTPTAPTPNSAPPMPGQPEPSASTAPAMSPHTVTTVPTKAPPSVIAVPTTAPHTTATTATTATTSPTTRAKSGVNGNASAGTVLRQHPSAEIRSPAKRDAAKRSTPGPPDRAPRDRTKDSKFDPDALIGE